MPGEYFLTICTDDHKCAFGEIIENEMRLSRVGTVVKSCWEEIPVHFSNVELDEYVSMPNHIHRILILQERTAEVEYIPVGAEYIQPLQKTFQHVVPNSIPSILRSFKAAVTREYILNNPLKWYIDEENLDRNSAIKLSFLIPTTRPTGYF